MFVIIAAVKGAAIPAVLFGLEYYAMAAAADADIDWECPELYGETGLAKTWPQMFAAWAVIYAACFLACLVIAVL